jgi:hypothetical protein
VPSIATGLPAPADSGATSTGGVQCGQVILNKTIYLVFVTPTTTTTTTTADGPISAGPVTTQNVPAAAPMTTTPVATGQPRKRSTPRKHSTRRHSAHNRTRAWRGKRALHIFLFRKSAGDGSRRVTALAGHAGRGS